LTELLLNLFWLLVALVGVGLWRLRWARGCRGAIERRAMVHSAVGLGCVLVMLFFAISLTDDLHAAPVLAEDARSSRRTLEFRKNSWSEPDPETRAANWAAVLPTAFFSPGRLILERLAIAEPPRTLSTLSRPAQGRAPPASLSLAL